MQDYELTIGNEQLYWAVTLSNLPEHPVSLFLKKFLVVLAFLLVSGPQMKLKFNQFL